MISAMSGAVLYEHVTLFAHINVCISVYYSSNIYL